MNCRILLLVMLVLGTSTLHAQHESRFYRINFEVDKHIPDPENLHILDNLVLQYRESGYCELTLSAHTDSDAGDRYNMQLSRKRAAAVSDYLVQKGIPSGRILVHWYGERKPDTTNNNIAGKATNRRVDIEMKQYRFSSVNEMLKTVAGNYTQTFKADATKPVVIIGKNGTVIKIPANALLSKEGKPVQSSDVNILLEEYMGPGDAALKQLSTICNGQILESGGMFSLNATLYGEPLELKKGSGVEVQLPAAAPKKDMQLFEAAVNSNGVTEWKTTGTPFTAQPKNAKKLPHVNMNTTLLKKYIPNDYTIDKKNAGYTYPVPRISPKPYMPKIPSYTVPQAADVSKWYERWILTSAMIEKRMEAETQKRQQAHAERMVKYQRRMLLYNQALEKYRYDSAAFEHAYLDAFRDWLHVQRNYHEQCIEVIEKKCFGFGLRKIISLSDSNLLTSSKPMGLLISYSSPDAMQHRALSMHSFMLQRINHMLSLSMTTVVQAFSQDGKIMLSYKGWKDQWYGEYRRNKYLSRTFEENPALEQAFTKAQNDIWAKREAAGIVDHYMVSQSYTTTLSRFGTFNCDRFQTIPPEQMARIQVSYPGNARVMFFVPSMNSYIYAYRDHGINTYSISLPKGLETKLVITAFDETTGPALHMEKRVFNANEIIRPEVKTVSLAEMRTRLESL